jgi:hypothetical protein
MAGNTQSNEISDVIRRCSVTLAQMTRHTIRATPVFHGLVLLALAVALIATNRNFVIIEDEAGQIGGAAQPVKLAATQFIDGGQLHPPLPDILLHYWLALTHASVPLLRIPSITYYVVGIWLLSRAAEHLAGRQAGAVALWLGVFWPYGFHFGRYAVWQPLCFLLVAWTTYACLLWLEQPTRGRMAGVALPAIMLVFTNYLGWVVLLLLAIEMAFQRPPRGKYIELLALGAVLAVIYSPVWAVLYRISAENASTPSRETFYATSYSLYVLFASESIAPWLLLSIPILLSILVSGIVLLIRGPDISVRLVLYSGALVLAMVITGTINQKRLMPVAPWLMLAIATAVPWLSFRNRRVLQAALCMIAVVSWFGIISRRFYSAPRNFEPWPQIAKMVAPAVLAHDTVIAEHPAFLFYLTKDVLQRQGTRDYRGNFVEQVTEPNLYAAGDWIDAGYPVTNHVVLVLGQTTPGEVSPRIAVAWLDRKCALKLDERFVPDPAAGLKNRFFLRAGQLQWRVELRKYDCVHDLTPQQRK